MTIPACLPLLASRFVASSRDETWAAGKRLAQSRREPPLPLSAEVTEADWDEAALALFQLLGPSCGHPDRPSNLRCLGRPAGAGLATALIGLAEESVETIAGLIYEAAYYTEAADFRRGRARGEAALAWAARADVYRRRGQPEHALAAFRTAHQWFRGSAGALVYTRIEDLYARWERDQGFLNSASAHFARVHSSYRSLGAWPAALDAAVRWISTLCEAGRARDAMAACREAQRGCRTLAAGSLLVREAAYLAARGRDAAAGQLQRIAGKGWLGSPTFDEAFDLSNLRFARMVRLIRDAGLKESPRRMAALAERGYEDWCRAQLLFGTPEAQGLHAMSRLSLAAANHLPADLSAPLTCFLSAPLASGPIVVPAA
ncbi:MAG TPA: hypothetical protein VGS22_15240 [Thermoanaerobaculia bacterium]|nr:hypothetical protein [Thermoanaerobaculia bacterium]